MIDVGLPTDMDEGLVAVDSDAIRRRKTQQALQWAWGDRADS